MAAQEPSARISPVVASDRRMRDGRDSETRDSTYPSADGNTSHEFAVSHDSAAAEKDGVNVHEGSIPGVATSDDLSSQSQGNSWEDKASQSKIYRHVFPALTGRDAGELRDIHQTKRQPRLWRTTFIRFGPLSGIFCMLLAIASLVASLGILAGSDKQPTPSWTVPPSTYLAIFTALANLSMRYAAIQGVVIAWWSRARNGSTVSKLHWDWHAGTTLRGALTAGRHMGMLGLACIFSTVVVIDGPLLQRSTSVVPAPYTNNNPVQLNVMMSPEIPHDSSGAYYHDANYRWTLAFNDTLPTPHGSTSNHLWPEYDLKIMSYVSRGWLDDRPFQGIIQDCPGVCKVKVKAPAMFVTTCTSHQRASNFRDIVSNDKVSEQAVAPPLEWDALIVSMQLVLGDKESANLITGIWSGEDCSGVLNYTICSLEAGIGEYTFTAHRDGSATLDPESALRPEFVAFANNTAVNHDFNENSRDYGSTLGGVVAMVAHRYNAYLFYYTGGAHPLGNLAGYLPVEQYQTKDTIGRGCPSFDRDPRDDVIQATNKLMIRMGAHTATRPLSDFQDKIDPGLVVNPTVTGELVGPHNVFHTQYAFFIGAAIVELVCIALVLPTYWGWWKLGRPVSFSPLEMAKAFESPLLAERNSNSSGRDLANATEGCSIQYGATASDSKFDGLKLAFANPDSISPPQRGFRYENH